MSRSALDGGTVNGDPHGPSADDLNAVVRAAVPSLQRCFDADPAVPVGVDVPVSVSYRIRPSGHTATVDVKGSASAAALDCVRGVVEGLRFPEFQGNSVAGSFPFSYRRDPPPAPEN